MAHLKLKKNSDVFSSLPTPSTPPSPSVTRSSRNKSVQWADWELTDVMEFKDEECQLTDDATQTETETFLKDGALPLIDSLMQTSIEISSLASRGSRSPSLVTCTTMEEEEEDSESRQAALNDLITHLEDTAALLRDYLMPSAPEPEELFSSTSFEQTVFLLKYLIVLVGFIQLVSILLLTLFDHLTENHPDSGYHILTRSCGMVLQILNMMLVSFATVVLSRQMLKYKVEGKFMAQTYLATVVTFAGLYFIIYRFDPESWEFGSRDKMEDNIAVTQYIQMLYLSVSAATLCGAANIQPRFWYVTLILCFQRKPSETITATQYKCDEPVPFPVEEEQKLDSCSLFRLNKRFWA
ncbi:uncharacterized protein LOC129224140 [Uloborus diversus]|uniref:uncharacterized protein LOC129224140 n=1 Tax=Uloborus diversus TaxID=327109 RepID=UPI002409B135|nr:uncharacterized protein LOC129224140 [Uloborus diversus]